MIPYVKGTLKVSEKKRGKDRKTCALFGLQCKTQGPVRHGLFDNHAWKGDDRIIRT